jgi:hypothetical protein
MFGFNASGQWVNFDETSNTQTNQTQNAQQATTINDPALQQAADQNLGFGMNAAANWNPTLATAPAGFTPDQITAMNTARGLAVGGQGSNAIDEGLWGANNAVSYQPQNVTGSTYDPSQMASQGYNASTLGGASGYQASQAGPVAAAAAQGYNASQLGQAQGYTAASGTADQQNRANIQNVGVQSAASQLPSYLQAFDPSYQTNVINASMNDLDRARQLTQQSNAAQAAQAGAFGDSREGVMDAQTNDDYLRQVASLSANERQSGFNTALSALQGDTSNQLQSQLANQQADIGVSANNAGYQNQFGLANLNAQNTALQYGAGAQNQFSQLNQQATNQALQFQADAANQASQQAAGLQASTNLANAAAQNAAGQFNATQNNQYGLANQSALNQAGQYNSQLGFNTAQNNQQALNQGAQYNAGNLQQANLANQQAGLAGQNVNLNAANSLYQGGQTQQNMGMNNYGMLNSIGNQQQAYNQAYQNTYDANQALINNAPLVQLGIGQSAVSNTPYTTAGTSSGTQTGTSNTQTQGSQSTYNASGGFSLSDIRLKTDIKPMTGTKPVVSMPVTRRTMIGRPVAVRTPVGPAVATPVIRSTSLGLPEVSKPAVADPMKAVHKLKPVTFRWKGTGQPDAGFSAQNIEEAHPAAARQLPNGLKGYSLPAVVGLLTAGLQHLDKKVSKKQGLLEAGAAA